MRDQFSTSELCAALDVSRSGFYAWLLSSHSPRKEENQILLSAIEKVHSHRHTRTYGSPRMTTELLEQGFQCSRNRVARIMRLHGIRPRSRRCFKPKTTIQDCSALPSPNLLADLPPPTQPGHQVVSDITYIRTSEGWIYLAVVLDLFSRSILGWKLSSTLHSELVTESLQNALKQGVIPQGALFHSDRGCQYTAAKTRKLLKDVGLIQSMSAKGYCYDNAFAESLFASLKADILPDNQSFPTREAASTAVFDYIETFYNRKRRHSSLNNRAPLDVINSHFQNLKPQLN